MVREPWVDLYSWHYNNKTKGGQPYNSFTNNVLRTHKMWNIYIRITIFDQNLGSKPQNFP